jgi:hypothetical protein
MEKMGTFEVQNCPEHELHPQLWQAVEFIAQTPYDFIVSVPQVKLNYPL